MSFTINNIYGQPIFTAPDVTDLRRAVLAAVSTKADLSGADLRAAYLRAAYLRAADLSGANLSGAIGVSPWKAQPLLALTKQVGPIRMAKLVKSDGGGPYYAGIVYEVGKSYEVADADTDATNDCGAGINLATFEWAIRTWMPGYRILVAEFEAADIAAIPTAGDGKFRVHRCRIVEECDLSEFGLVEATGAAS